MRRMWSVAIVLACLAAPALGWAATKYVRPASACALSGDGTSFACASSGGGVGAWKSGPNTAALNPGDTLKVCGTFSSADRLTSNVLFDARFSGSAGNPIAVTGDCTAEGGLSGATLDGEGDTLWCYFVDNRAYQTVSDLIIKHCTSRGIFAYQSAVADVTLDKFLTFTRVTVQDIRGAGSICFDSRGRNITFQDGVIERCGDDGAFHNGKRYTVRRNTLSSFSMDSGNSGDAIQVTGEVDGLVIEDNTINFANVDSKYGVLVGGITDSPTGIIRRNDIVRSPTFTVASALAFDAIGTWWVYGNSLYGGVFGIHESVTTTSTGVANVFSNLIRQPSSHGIELGTSTATTGFWNNTIVYPGGNGIHSNTGGATTSMQDNIIVKNGGTCIDKLAANIESHNDLYLCATPVANSGVGTGVGTGTITTDPQFAGATDFHLLATSPARRSGTWWGNGCVDRRGRTCLTPPDRGAYQHAGGDLAPQKSARP